MRPGDHGEEVRRLQQMLLELGYPLPRFGADGWIGSETLAAVGMFLRDHAPGRPDNPEYVADVDRALIEAIAGRPVPLPPVADEAFFDLRGSASPVHDYGQRPWTRVTGITLHQTACVLGENPPRWATVGSHLGITRGGKVIWLHGFLRLIRHGHGWNAQCVGVELDGLYAGVEGDASTVWNDPSTPQREVGLEVTSTLVEAARATVRWICAEVERHGGKVRALVAHRQASRNRRNDPGSALWQAIALPLHQELGLHDGGVGFRLGDGYPIPHVWDPRCKGVPY